MATLSQPRGHQVQFGASNKMRQSCKETRIRFRAHRRYNTRTSSIHVSTRNSISSAPPHQACSGAYRSNAICHDKVSSSIITIVSQYRIIQERRHCVSIHFRVREILARGLYKDRRCSSKYIQYTPRESREFTPSRLKKKHPEAIVLLQHEFCQSLVRLS